MNIYFIRHGIAEEKVLGESDFDRKLSPEGVEKLKTSAKAWKVFIRGFDYLISSPLLRAVQTAEVIKTIFSIREIYTDKRLSPGSTTEDVIELVNEYDAEDIAVFGHEPDFSMHVSNLISSSGASIDFKKGAIAKISFPSKARLSGGVLEFLIPAKVFTKS